MQHGFTAQDFDVRQWIDPTPLNRYGRRARTPDLSDEGIELFRRQKDFQPTYGFLDRDFDFDQWIDRRPLEEARKRLDVDANRAAA